MSDHDDVASQVGPEPMCEHTIDLGAYLLGGLTELQARTLRAHIDMCEFCSAELRVLRPVADLLDSTELASSIIAERLEPSADVRDRIFSAATSDLSTHGQIGDHVGVGTARPERDLRSRRTKQLLAASAVAFSLGAGSVLGIQRLAADDKPKRPGERIAFAKVALPGIPAAIAADPKTKPKGWVYIEQQDAGTYAWLYVSDFEVGKIYKWWFIKKDGSRVGLGSFRFPKATKGEEWLRCPGHTAIDRSELIAVGATDEQGVDVIRQDLPKAPTVVVT